nr:MAG TPA: hypothetical protein [Caudoviricetes sp.]
MLLFVRYGIIILQGKAPCKQTECNTNCKGVLHMKIKIPYVVVTAVKGREVNDVVFIDTASRKTCADNMKANGVRVLNTVVKKCELDLDYTDAVSEVIFTEVCKQSGANIAWDDIAGVFIDIPAESAGDSND